MKIKESLFIVVLLLGAAHASAFDMGSLSKVIEANAEGPWTVRDDSGAVLLENTNTPGSIEYYFAGIEKGTEGRRMITVDVSLVKADAESMAGLLYGFTATPKSYFLFTLAGDGSVSLHFFDNGNFEERWKTQIDGLDVTRTTLSIQEQGDQILLLVNGEQASGFGNDRVGKGAVGIVAANVGTYRFAKFRVDSVAAN